MPSPFPLADRLLNRLARSLPQRRVDIATPRPIVSFTFDDVPESAFINGARILERYDALGTFYVAGGLAGRKHDGQRMLAEEGYRELVKRGHELGHHTFSHRRPIEIGGHYRADLDRNDAFLSAVTEQPARNFAYPYGLSSLHARAEMGRFRSARGAHSDINRGPTDLENLASIDIRPTSDTAGLLGWIDQVVAAPGWLIYFTHDVSDTPSTYGVRPDILEQLVAHARNQGCEILTVDSALDRLEVAP